MADYREVNQFIEQAAMPMLCLEELGLNLKVVMASRTLDMFQGYCQTPLHASAQELSKMVIAGDLYTPTRVLQGVLNATAYFRATMTDVFNGLIERMCLVRMDDVV